MATLSDTYLPVIAGVAVVGDHVLRLLFSDGIAGDIDFSAEHWTGVLEPLNDSAYFAQVTVDLEAGTIAWPDGIDLAPEPLYEQAREHPLAAACIPLTSTYPQTLPSLTAGSQPPGVFTPQSISLPPLTLRRKVRSTL